MRPNARKKLKSDRVGKWTEAITTLWDVFPMAWHAKRVEDRAIQAVEGDYRSWRYVCPSRSLQCPHPFPIIPNPQSIHFLTSHNQYNLDFPSPRTLPPIH